MFTLVVLENVRMMLCLEAPEMFCGLMWRPSY